MIQQRSRLVGKAFIVSREMREDKIKLVFITVTTVFVLLGNDECQAVITRVRDAARQQHVMLQKNNRFFRERSSVLSHNLLKNLYN